MKEFKGSTVIATIVVLAILLFVFIRFFTNKKEEIENPQPENKMQVIQENGENKVIYYAPDEAMMGNIVDQYVEGK